MGIALGVLPAHGNVDVIIKHPLQMPTYTVPAKTWTPGPSETQWPPLNEDPVNVPDQGYKINPAPSDWCSARQGIENCGVLHT